MRGAVTRADVDACSFPQLLYHVAWLNSTHVGASWGPDLEHPLRNQPGAPHPHPSLMTHHAYDSAVKHSSATRETPLTLQELQP